jgi:circadian clock protein KaiB
MNEQEAVPANSEQSPGDEPVFTLRLFITGVSPNSVRAVANTKNMCEKYLAGRYELEIIDVYQQPLIAEKEQLIAIPMLIRKFPLPERRLIGDMSDTIRVLTGLEVKSDM